MSQSSVLCFLDVALFYRMNTSTLEIGKVYLKYIYNFLLEKNSSETLFCDEKLKHFK